MFDEDELICERCAGHMTVGYGMEPTRHCHACAHELAEREPLTEAAILDILVRIDLKTRRLPEGFKQFARAIEAAHGINGVREGER